MAGEEQQTEVLVARIDSEPASDRNLIIINESVEDLRASLYEKRLQLKSLAAVAKLARRARWTARLLAEELAEQRKEIRQLKKRVAWTDKHNRLLSWWQEHYTRRLDACLKDSREFRARKEEKEKARHHEEEFRLLKYQNEILDRLIICTVMIVAIIVCVAWK